MNRVSQAITHPKNKGPAQSMLYALGLSPPDFSKFQVGIGSVAYDSNPCNAKLNKLSKLVQKSINKSDSMIGFKFNTVGVSDGITMGTSGMNYSLPSRELIADSIETIAGAHFYDGLICIPGCDKNLPACLMAMLRLNRPGFIIYGGAMQPSYYNNEKLDIVSTFESYGKYIKKTITENEYNNIIQNACHSDCGACSGLYTANTMASILEVMGITLPNSSSNPSMSHEKFNECNQAGKTMDYLLNNTITPRDIITKESFNNAIKLTYLLGGSTNAVIHLLAIAKNGNINLRLSDFNNFSSIPVITNMKPHGEYVMNDLHKYGGMTSLLEYFIDEKYINGNIPTITGKTLLENIKDIQSSAEVKKLIKPIKNTSHIRILYGNAAPYGCVAKIYNDDIKPYNGKIRVFESENALIKELEKGSVKMEDAILIRNQGESIGCPEMLNSTSALIGYFGEDNVPPLLTDGRFSGGSRGILIAHLPDANQEGNITRYIQNGDKIIIDMSLNKINIIFEEYDLDGRIRTIDYDYYSSIDSNSYIHKYSRLVSNIESGYSI